MPAVALIVASTAGQCALASNERTKSEVRGMSLSDTETASGSSAARLLATPPHLAKACTVLQEESCLNVRARKRSACSGRKSWSLTFAPPFLTCTSCHEEKHAATLLSAITTQLWWIDKVMR